MGNCFEGLCPLSEIKSQKYRETHQESSRLNSITCEQCSYLSSSPNHQKIVICPDHQICKICKPQSGQCSDKQFCTLCEHFQLRRAKKRKEKSAIQRDSQIKNNQRSNISSSIKQEDNKNSKLKSSISSVIFNPSAITQENGNKYIKGEGEDWEYVVLKRNLQYGVKSEVKLLTNDKANILIGVTNQTDPNFTKHNLFGLCSYHQYSIFSDKYFYILNKSVRSNSTLSLEVDLEQNKEITFSQYKQESTDSSIKQSEKPSETICNLMIPDSMLKRDIYIFIALCRKGDYFEIVLD